MPILPIETESEKTNKILRTRSTEVKDVSAPEIQRLISDMKETLKRSPNGIGLAAPQIGVNLRIFVAAPELGLNQTVFINPVITKISQKKELMDEGCLSVLDKYGKINRASSLKVEALNERGRKFKMKADGLIAQLVQHEVDHLDGILFKDKTEIITNYELRMEYKIIFMGTPALAATLLEKLIQSKTYKPNLVITQPDRPVGRKQILTPPPVKTLAEKHGIAVWQPDKIKNDEAIEKIKRENPDLIIVAAYGKIIPKEIIAVPRFGVLNVHASLLPVYRGASPISEAILNGDKETGATIMLIDEELDHGPILSQKRVAITIDDTAETLGRKIATTGADLLLDTIPGWVAGAIRPQEQDHARATHTKIITKQDGEIKKEYTAEQIERMPRAYYPWPGVHLNYESRIMNQESKILKIIKVKFLSCENNLPPLSFFITENKQLALKTAKDCLILETVQPAGKKPMSGYDFYLGNRHIIS